MLVEVAAACTLTLGPAAELLVMSLLVVPLCCALMVHVRAWSINLANPVADAPNRLDVADLFMQRCGRRQRSWTSGSDLCRRDLIGALQRAGQSAPRLHCGW